MWFACHVPLANSNKQFIVDPWNYEKVRKHKWSLSPDGTTIRTSVNGETVTIGRFLLGIPKGSKMEADHFNRDIYNNLLINLSIVTHQQNCQNRGKKKSTSKFYGIYKRKGCEYWEAQIWVNGQNLYLGKFSREEDAARAYDLKARKYGGPLNFPDEIEKIPEKVYHYDFTKDPQWL